MASRATSNLAHNLPQTMAGQSSLREELNVMRRRAWERRNQEAQQDRELLQESPPLFGEPYKTNKGDELSSLIQRMLGNYEDGNNSQYGQHEGMIKDRTKDAPSYGRPGHPSQKDKNGHPFQNSSNYSSSQLGHPGHNSAPPSKKNPIPDGPSMTHNKEGPPDSHQKKTDSWQDRDYTTLPPVLSDLSPPADPLSPLHSSESSDSEQDTDNDHDRAPEHDGSSSRVESLHHSEAQKEVPQLTGDAPPLVSQTFSLPLSSKSNLTNSRKPMALVRPMDGPGDQMTSESPDLKPSPEDFHGQSYESLPDFKNVSKPNLPTLKIPSMETLSNEVHSVEDILIEMTHSWPPLLTAIHTPSTTEPSKFSFSNKEPHVHPTYQQPQKQHESLPKAPLLPCRTDTVVPEDSSTTGLASTKREESGSSSDSDSSSGSESDSESSDSGTDENPPAQSENTPPAKMGGLKDISWQLISWIKESQPILNPQNHSDVVNGPKTKTATSSKPQGHTLEESKPKNKRYSSSHTPPTKLGPRDTDVQAKSTGQQANSKPTSKPAVTGHRKTVGNKHPEKSSKAPRAEEGRTSLQVESVELTPRDKDSTFTDRPKVKTKNNHEKSEKSESRKSSKQVHSDKKEGKSKAPKAKLTVEVRKMTAPAPSVSPTALRATSPASKSASTMSSVQTETLNQTEITPAKSTKKSRVYSSTRDTKRHRASKAAPDVPQSLVVKINLSQLSRVPQPAKNTKSSEKSSKKGTQEKEHGSAGKVDRKRPAEKNEPSVPKKKPKMEKESKTSSFQHSSSKTETSKSASEDKQRKSSKKTHASLPHGSSQEQPKSSGHKRHSGETVQSSSSSSKHKKKSSSKQEHGKSQKKTPKSSTSTSEPAACPAAPATNRPLLKFEDRQYSVDYHMKEAKKLKHKADATPDKMGKAFNYLDAAMSFVESGIAMETDPQTPKSAYTMFSETVDLIRFILKLKNYLDPSAPASERDFLVLCMRCQALLQMAMFRCKRESALKYSRTLTDHFKNSKNMQTPSPCISKSMGTPSPMSPMPSPASSASSGPASNPSSSTVAIPQIIQQVASSYVNITALFLSAHDTWEQAEEFARKGSGILNELDGAMGQLSLTSAMNPLVRYTRQGLHWLKLDTSNSH